MYDGLDGKAVSYYYSVLIPLFGSERGSFTRTIIAFILFKRIRLGGLEGTRYFCFCSRGRPP